MYELQLEIDEIMILNAGVRVLMGTAERLGDYAQANEWARLQKKIEKSVIQETERFEKFSAQYETRTGTKPVL